MRHFVLQAQLGWSSLFSRGSCGFGVFSLRYFGLQKVQVLDLHFTPPPFTKSENVENKTDFFLFFICKFEKVWLFLKTTDQLFSLSFDLHNRTVKFSGITFKKLL